jgi:hypothetical protein
MLMYVNLNKINPIFEEISHQLNDPIVENLVMQFKKIKSTFDEYHGRRHANGYKTFMTPGIQAGYESINKLIYERFGLPIRHIYAENTPYAVLTISPLAGSPIKETNNDYESIMKEFNSIAGKCSITPDESEEQSEDCVFKEPEEMSNVRTDYSSVLFNALKSFNEIEQTMNTKGVVVDLAKAKIENLPIDYSITVLTDIKELFKYSLTPLELTAILLHEIGHVFTHIEQTYRSVRTTTQLAEALNSESFDSKTKAEKMKLVYGKVLDGDVNDLQDVNDKKMMVLTIDKYIEKQKTLHNNDGHSYTDSESLADQFVAKFGLGHSLSSALVKIHRKTFIRITPLPSQLLRLGLLTIMLFTMKMLAFLLIHILVISLMTTIYTQVFLSTESGEHTYDNNVKRVERVKYELIKILRTAELTRTEKKKLVNDISATESTIKNMYFYSNKRTSLLDKFLTKNRQQINHKILEEKFEKMINNDLHLASHRFDLLHDRKPTKQG